MDQSLELDLQTFVERAERLSRTRLVTDVLASGFQLQTTIEFDVEKGMRSTSVEPPEDDLMAFALLLRPFMTQRDRVSLRRILNACRENLARDFDRTRLQDARGAWELAAKGGLVSIKLNEQVLMPERIADLSINGYYFHDDADKRAQLAENIPSFHQLVRQEFISFLIATANFIWFASGVIRRALEDRAFI